MAKTKTEAKDLLREQVENLAGPSTGTIVRFEYTFERKGEAKVKRKGEVEAKVKRTYYTYIALWGNEKWYLTGNNTSLPREMTNLEFLQLIATEQARRASVATSFDSFKP